MAEVPRESPPPLPQGSKACRTNWLIVGLSAILFVVACTLDALEFDRSLRQQGIQVLLIGWMALLLGYPGWLANPALLLGWIFALNRSRPWTFICAFGAFLLSTSVVQIFGKEIPKNEGGTEMMHLTRLLPGFYVWSASMVALAVGSLALPRRVRKTNEA